MSNKPKLEGAETVQDGELFKFEKVGDSISGVLESYKSQNTANGVGHVYEVRTKEGVVAFFASTLLHKKLQNIQIGNIVMIEFTEVTKTNAKNDLKHFDVGHAPASEANLKQLGIEIFNKVEDEEEGGGDDDF